MKKVKDIISIIILVILIAITSILGYKFHTVMGQMNAIKLQINQISENAIDLYKIAEIMKLYDLHYIDELKTNKYYEDTMLKTLVTATGDRYGVFITAAEAKSVEKQLFGEYTGVGIIIEYPEGEEFIVVNEVYKGYPADNAGVKVGDKIYKINGIIANSEEGIVELQNISISGAKSVTLTFEDGDKTINLEKIIMDTVKTEVKDNIGIVTIDSFAATTGDEFIEDFDKLIQNKNIEYLIFDVRDNSGGDKDAVTKMIDRLAPEGEIYTEVYKNSSKVINSDKKCVDIPIILLGNGESASASELFIMSLQDTNNATFIGEQTFGKSTILSYFPFDDGSALLMSTGYYYPPSDRFIEEIGITPDIEETEDAMSRAFEFIKNGK